MRKRWYQFFILIGFFFSSINSHQDLRISVIIPCHPKHASYLPELLQAYEGQTVLPDEVVISLSQVDQVPQHILDTIQSDQWAFSVRCILLRHKAFAGENRNTACSAAKGDVFLCQDADDLPTASRVEVVKYFFSKHVVDYLMHGFYFTEEIIDSDSLTVEKPFEEIRRKYVQTYDEIWGLGERIHFGNIALRRSLFDRLKWSARPTGQDVEFCQKVLHNRAKALALLEPLTIYRIELSSWKLKKRNVLEQIFVTFEI